MTALAHKGQNANSYSHSCDMNTQTQYVMLRCAVLRQLQEETGITAVADPWGGSYFMETLTAQLESAAESLLQEVEGLGGMTEALMAGRGLDRKHRLSVHCRVFVLCAWLWTCYARLCRGTEWYLDAGNGRHQGPHSITFFLMLCRESCIKMHPSRLPAQYASPPDLARPSPVCCVPHNIP